MQGEVVLITGGSSGIGLAAARRFVASGARVWITARGAERLEQVAASLGGATRAFPADVTDPASLAALVEEIRRSEGRIDILINSAGQLELGSAEQSAAEMAERLMRVNYFGLVRVVAASLPLMRTGSRKSIVNVASFVGRIVPPYWSAYAATKHAVMAYSHALRQEVRSEGFHVGVILPGPVESPMTDGLFDTPMYPIPFGVPILKPEQIADAIAACVQHRKVEVTVPGSFGPILRLGSAFPRLVDLFYRPFQHKANRP